VVLDALLGSGRALIAAARVARICYALGIDPLYLEVAIRRWQTHSGGCARLAASGESFAKREANGGLASKAISA
jgi:DNA modification methylase